MAMGAFIVGLLIADSSYRRQIIAEIQPFRGLLLGLFFMSKGMSLNLDLFIENPLVLLGVLVALMAAKVITLCPLSRLFGIKSKGSISVTSLLAQSGEFALVLFALEKGRGLLVETLFQNLIVVVLLGMLAMPALEKLAYRLSPAARKSITTMPDIEVGGIEQDALPAILAGFGRMDHRIGYILDRMTVPYVAIDTDASLVDCERAEGESVHFEMPSS